MKKYDDRYIDDKEKLERIFTRELNKFFDKYPTYEISIDFLNKKLAPTDRIESCAISIVSSSKKLMPKIVKDEDVKQTVSSIE